MGIWSLLFPNDDDRLRRARDLMAKGRHEDARKGLLHCKLPEAEALYDECCKHLEKDDRAAMKSQLAAAGFHGWKIEISLQNPRRKAEMEALVAEEIKKAGVDLDLPDIDQEAVQAAVLKAQRRARQKGAREAGEIKLVPIVPGRPARPAKS
jgi:hypothetical protein